MEKICIKLEMAQGVRVIYKTVVLKSYLIFGPFVT